jgi:hypothetical protein
MRLFIISFFIANLFLGVFFIDLWTTNSNTTSRILPAVTFIESGTFCIDKYEKLTIDKSIINGHYYSDKSPLPTWILIPLFSFFKFLGIADLNNGSLYGPPIYILADVLLGSIPFACIATLFFIVLSKNSGNERKFISPVILSTLPLYGSFLFIFSGTAFSHLFSGLLLFSTYLLIKRGNYLTAGVFAGLCFLCEYTLTVFFILWTLQIMWNEKKFWPSIRFVFGIMPSIILICIYNYCITGSAFDMIYKYHTFEGMDHNYAFTLPSMESLWSLSFSSFRGLFFYTPVLFLALFYFIKKIVAFPVRNSLAGILNNHILLPSIIFFFVIASYSYWDGGWTYGPRFLTGAGILLLFESAVYFSKNEVSKIMFWGLSISGFICAAAAKATLVYSLPSDSRNPVFELIFPALYRGDLNMNNILSALCSLNPTTAVVTFLILFPGIILFLNSNYRNFIINNHSRG